MKLLFVTTGRSKRGGCIILTALMNSLIGLGYDVSVATFKMQGDDSSDVLEIWDDFKDQIIEIPFDKEKDIKEIQQVEFITEYLKKVKDSYERIIIDSWLVACSAIKAGIISDKKVWHLVQSNPEFVPENSSVYWKSLLFSIIPHFPSNKIAVSNSLAEELKVRYNLKSEIGRYPLY